MWKIEWIIPVIIGAVWILGAILKAKEALDAKPKAPPQRNPGKELDQFLQEIERLRKDQEAKAKQPTYELSEVDVEAAPAQPIIVARPVLRAMTPRARAAPPVVRPPANRTAQPMAETVATMRKRIDAVERPMTPVVKMLRNPQTLAAAMVLHEVLGPPRCKQR